MIDKVLSTTANKFVKKSFVTTIYLVRNDDPYLRPFFCPDCRNMILQYGGEVARIVPDQTSTNLPIVVQCRNRDCGRKYQFISFVDLE